MFIIWYADCRVVKYNVKISYLICLNYNKFLYIVFLLLLLYWFFLNYYHYFALVNIFVLMLCDYLWYFTQISLSMLRISSMIRSSDYFKRTLLVIVLLSTILLPSLKSQFKSTHLRPRAIAGREWAQTKGMQIRWQNCPNIYQPVIL